MATRPDLIEFQSGTLAKASEVNYNFNEVVNYVDDIFPFINSQIETGLTGKFTFADSIVSLSGTNVTLSNNKGHRITISGNTTFVLPSQAVGKMSQMLVQVALPEIYSIDLGTTHYFYDTAPSLTEIGEYDIIYEHNGSNWVVGAIYKG